YSSGGCACIECAGPAAGDRLERCGEFALHQELAFGERLAVAAEEDLRGSRPAREPQLSARQRVGNVVLNWDAVAGKLDRRCDQVREREGARAVALVGERKPSYGAWHADRQCRIARFARIGLALLVEEHVAGRRLRRGL